MNKSNTQLKKIPAVNTLLNHTAIKNLVDQYGHGLVVHCIQLVLQKMRSKAIVGEPLEEIESIEKAIIKELGSIANPNLKPVINATGILIHTNLGRAPFGEVLIQESLRQIPKYNNLEFDLEKGKRGQRDTHIASILKYLTGAEDIIVVNNNAAAMMLILRTFAKRKEVVVSRGELIEIGGAFRVPDILKASDCKMVEVGTTNKTKVSDYENVITNKTAILLKTHKSNYTIKGFTKEVSLQELVDLGKEKEIPVLFDIGSGLLKRVNHPAFADEPDVKQALSTGVDMLCFSGDKLLGGPQAGIIAGKKKYIDKLKKEPMMRALRVGKTTLALLETASRYYLNEDELFSKNVFYKTLLQTQEQLESKAKYIQKQFQAVGIQTNIEVSEGLFGGGTLPDKIIESFTIEIKYPKSQKHTSKISEQIYLDLLQSSSPVLAILKKGKIFLDVLTLETEEMESMIEQVIAAYHKNIVA